MTFHLQGLDYFQDGSPSQIDLHFNIIIIQSEMVSL
jgi:hypothetical protein